MKLRRLPEDFCVDELATFPVGAEGPFCVYRLRKRGLGTPEAIDRICRRWNLRRSQVSYGGLKDRHAVTGQLITIRGGPQRSFETPACSLDYLGRAHLPFTPGQIAGNRFRIVLRSMNREELPLAEQALGAVRCDGLPNYFDDQRFGSVGMSGELIAAAWVRGNYERALWLTFADAHPFDRAQEKEQKRLLREHWGDWTTCKRLLSKSHRRSIVTFLDDRPGDFRGAWARVRQDMRSLYLAAFQSDLWNQLLARWLRAEFPAEALVEVPLKMGPVPFPTRQAGAGSVGIRPVELPLPSARIKLEPGPVQELVDRTLAELGWARRELRVKYPRDSFFSKGWRRALIPVDDLHWSRDADELAPSLSKLTLQFSLPRGSYATILVKRVTVAARAEFTWNELLEEDSLSE